MSRKRKASATTTPLIVAIVFFSLFLCLSGFLIAYVICVDRISEMLSGLSHNNNWFPFSGNYIDYLRQLPASLYVAIFYSPMASLAALVFFPVAIFVVPLYEAVFLNSYALLINGVLPFIVGVGGLLFSVYLQDTQRSPKVKPLEFDD